jgi:hypothetical protein
MLSPLVHLISIEDFLPVTTGLMIHAKLILVYHEVCQKLPTNAEGGISKVYKVLISMDWFVCRTVSS